MKKTVFLLAAFMVAAVAATTSANVIAFWEFNDAPPGTVTEMGQRIVDSSGNGRDLVVINQTPGGGEATPVFDDPCPWYNGGTGSSLRFSTAGDALKFILGHDFEDGGPNASSSDIDFGMSDSFTMEFLVRSRSVNSGSRVTAPISKIEGGANDPQWWFRYQTNGTMGGRGTCVNGQSVGGYTTTSVGNFHDGQWHHVAWVRDASAASRSKVYIDHQLVRDVEDPTTGSWVNSGEVIIGAFPGVTSRDWNGSIGFVKITGAALSPAQFEQFDKIEDLPTNPSPGNYEDNISTSTTLSWDPIPDVTIDSHTVRVASDSAFGSIVQTFNGVVGNSVAITNLKQSRTYYWVVDTQGSDPNGPFYREGDMWSFNTEDAEPYIAGFWTFDQYPPGTMINPGDKITDISGNNRNLYVETIEDFEEGDAYYDSTDFAYGTSASYYGSRTAQMLLIPGYKFLGDTEVTGSSLPFDSNSDFTIEAVIRVEPDASVFSSIMSYLPEPEYSFWYGSDAPQYWFRVQNNGFLRLWIQDEDDRSLVTGSTYVRDGNWHHVAAVRDTSEGKIRIYVNGELDVEGNDITTDIYPNGLVSIGGFDGVTSRNFNGNIDFVKVTRAALEPQDFVQAMPLPKNPDPIDGAEGVPASYVLTWTPAEGVTVLSQTVYIATDSFMNNIVAQVEAVGNTAFVELENNNTYYWMVQTTTPDDTFDGNIWSYSTPMCMLSAQDGDLNGDCIVDINDFAIMASNWLRSEFE